MRKCIALILMILCLIPSQSLLHASGEVTIYSDGKTVSITARKGILSSVINAREMDFSYGSLSVFIDAALIEPRGRMAGGLITLSSRIIRDSEFLKLFVHELGHYLDINVLGKDATGYDISQRFYAISWQSPTVKRSSESLASFVSGYALSNQYEDFAESFVFYVFHNQIFADRALRNDSLRQKYLFIQQNLFPEGTFTDTDFTIGRMPSYSWDSTKIPISLQKYLYSLN